MRDEIALSVVPSAIYAAPAAPAMRAWRTGAKMFSDLPLRARPVILAGATA